MSKTFLVFAIDIIYTSIDSPFNILSKNIYIAIDKSPCGMLDDCEHCKKCRELMSLDLVCSQFEKTI